MASVVSGAAIAIASMARGRHPNAALASSAMSERSSAWTAAANRKGSVSMAAIATIRQYVDENHVLCNCGLVVLPSTAAVSFRTP
jgi:hypothetical protein